MEATPTNRIIGRIKKMLALASDSGATEGERDNALRMAHATLAKYNLSMLEVEEATHVKDSSEPRIETSLKFYGRAPWARQCAQAIGKMMFCYYFYTTDRNDRSNVHHWFVGRHSNSVSASILSEFVVKSILSEGKKRAKDSCDKDYARVFCVGASSRIVARVQQIIDAATKPEAAPGTALVLASLYSRELEENKKAVEKYKLRSRASHTKGMYNTAAYEAGKQFGNSISLNKSIGQG